MGFPFCSQQNPTILSVSILGLILQRLVLLWLHACDRVGMDGCGVCNCGYQVNPYLVDWDKQGFGSRVTGSMLCKWRSPGNLGR